MKRFCANSTAWFARPSNRNFRIIIATVLAPYVVPGRQNQLAIRLDNPPDSPRWYPGGAIHRNMWLVRTHPIHIGQ